MWQYTVHFPRGKMKIPARGTYASALLVLMASVIAATPASAQTDQALEHVLDIMDKAGASFRTTEANFVWQQYTSLVKETDTQKGKIYFKRSGSDIQMAVDVTDPPKYVLLSGGKLQLYMPRTTQVTVYDTEKYRGEVEAFLVLGFGGGGHSMLKSFEVKYLGTESEDGVEAAKLDLTPKSPKLRNTFEHIILWIDLARGVSVRQQFFQPGGDYRLADYSDIRINQKVPDSVFKLKTNGKTVTQSASSSQ
jgi:outer membrane lipoprotein-sorting protein